MTPREVDELTHDEYLALAKFQQKEIRETEKAINKANRQR